MILTDTYQDLYNNLITKILLAKAMPYIVAIIGIIAIVLALCSITRNLKEISGALNEISHDTKVQKNLLAGIIRLQTNNGKYSHASNQHSNQEQDT